MTDHQGDDRTARDLPGATDGATGQQRGGELPGTTGPNPPTEQVLGRRCVSLTRRILAGAGEGSLLAHAMVTDDADPLDWTCSFQAHGITGSGRLLVALRNDPTRPICQIPAGLATDVRVEFTKDSPEPSIRLLTATLHLVGTLTWLGRDQIDHLLATDVLPPTVAIIASFEDAVIGVITPKRAVIHDSMGSTPVDVVDILARTRDEPAFPSVEDELSTLDVVQAHGDLALLDLCQSVLAGTIVGHSCWARATHHACPHTIGHVFCADVDRTGLTLMYITGETTGAVFVPFGQEATSLAELEAMTARLPLDSDPVRPTRV